MRFENAYKLTGIVAASTARLILEGLDRGPGCFLLHQGINVEKMMALLEENGICVKVVS